MSVVHLVTVLVQRECAKCHSAIEPGTKAVKRRIKRKRAEYYHPDCWKK